MRAFTTHTPMKLTRICIVLLSSCVYVFGTEFRQEYYTDVTFNCNVSDMIKNKNNTKQPAKRVWVLPDGHQIDDSYPNSDTDKIALANETFELMVKHISDEDFGTYICIVVWQGGDISVVRHGLNLDGAVFDSLIAKYKERAIVGGISAAVMLALVLVTYTVWYFTCSDAIKRKQRLLEDLEKGVDRYSTLAYDNVGLEMYTKKTQP